MFITVPVFRHLDTTKTISVRVNMDHIASYYANTADNVVMIDANTQRPMTVNLTVEGIEELLGDVRL